MKQWKTMCSLKLVKAFSHFQMNIELNFLQVQKQQNYSIENNKKNGKIFYAIEIQDSMPLDTQQIYEKVLKMWFLQNSGFGHWSYNISMVAKLFWQLGRIQCALKVRIFQ